MQGYQKPIAVIIVAIETIKYYKCVFGKRLKQEFESQSSMYLVNGRSKT